MCKINIYTKNVNAANVPKELETLMNAGVERPDVKFSWIGTSLNCRMKISQPSVMSRIKLALLGGWDKEVVEVGIM